MEVYLNFIHDFYKTDQLNAIPEITYSGGHQEKVLKKRQTVAENEGLCL
jgi:hypothetical protein